MLLALVLAAGWAPTAVAGEWRSMEQLRDCAGGGCWQARDADGSVVASANNARSSQAALTMSLGDPSARQGIAGAVPPPGKDKAGSKKDEGGVSGAIKRGAGKAWGFVKENWPGIVGGIAGGLIGTMLFGPIGGIVGGLIGTLLGHFASGLFSEKP